MKQSNEKLLKWQKKDLGKNIAVYLINAVIILALFVGTIYFRAIRLNEQFNLKALEVVRFFALTCLLLVVMMLYFYFEERNFLKNPANSQMLFFIVELSIILCFLASTYISPYLRPLALPALLTLFLCNRRSAFLIQMLFCILQVIMDMYSYASFSILEFALPVMGITSGFIAVFTMDKVYSRFKLLILSPIISIPILVYVAMAYINGNMADVLTSIICALCSGPVAVVALTFILPFFEVGFKKVSCFKYAELTDHKSRLIKKMRKEAPGTFNHSVLVSNIAEACAAAIDEDALLARACAYYHDIGKLRRPEFFTENQQDGVNPHDDLTPELSTNIIKAHAQDGYNLAIKSRLPKEIAEACLEHHGTLPILYFYEKAKRFTDGEVDIKRYSYSCPKPSNKISAIIMIADGCEAAVRTLTDRSRENVKTLVRKIVNDRMKLGQFDNCEITIKELNIIINTVVNNLTGIYHDRIEYPKVSLDGVETSAVMELLDNEGEE
ncbi:MAG: HDIG domain-containing protein [Clostridia bacterium]|nr:HDIG domain-containing protein [Clostridia bacterium]